MRLRYQLLLFSLLSVMLLQAQAGQDTYQFLNLPYSARTAALGGSNVSLYDNDINLAFTNPALLSPRTNNILGLNYTNYISDINLGSAVYGRNFGDNNFMAFSINYIDYGTFIHTDELDQTLGEFTAKDFVANIVYTRRFTDNWTVGATFKPIYSVYERYSSFGVAFDLGASYHNESVLFSAGLVLRNMGWQFTGYHSIDGKQHRETLPFEIEAGITQGLKHAPIRFHMTLTNLQRWDLSYSYGNNANDAYTEKTKAGNFFDMLFRHTIFAVEILPTKNFYIVASYNHRRRMEMRIPDKKTIAGFSFGAGLKLYKFQVGFAIAPYQVGNLSYHATLSTSLSEFGVK